eukprot:COSAG06_NODE_36712_length_443_cov_5.037791_1_plen_51_part_10
MNFQAKRAQYGVLPPGTKLSSDQLPKDTHQVSGLMGSGKFTPSLVVWDLVR